MTARGSESKNIITAKLLETFAGSFIYDKNIIVPMVENGESLQIKIAVTCAKVNIERGGETVSAPTPAKVSTTAAAPSSPATNLTGPTEEEKQMIANLLEKMGI